MGLRYAFCYDELDHYSGHGIGRRHQNDDGNRSAKRELN